MLRHTQTAPKIENNSTVCLRTLIARRKSDCLITVCQILGGGGKSGSSNLLVEIIIVLSLKDDDILISVFCYVVLEGTCETPSITLCYRGAIRLLHVGSSQIDDTLESRHVFVQSTSEQLSTRWPGLAALTL